MRYVESPPRRIFWILAIFWLLFGIKTGAFLDTINILAGAFIAWAVFSRRRLPLADPIIILILVYGLLSNFSIFAGGVWDQWHLFQPWRAAINYLGVTVAIREMIRENWKWQEVLSAVNIAIYIHALIILFTFLQPDLRIALNSVTGFVEKSYLRSPGLTHSYGITSLVMGFPFVSVFFSDRRISRPWFDTLGLLACFISLFLTARVGLYSLPLTVGAAAIRYAITGRLKARHLWVPAVPMAIVLLFVQAHDAEWFSNSSTEDAGLTSAAGLFINEGLVNSLELFFTAQDGNANIKSTETIGQFLFHNNGIMDGLFGTGLYGRGDALTYLATDISYAHFFSMVGLVGLSLLLIIHLVPLAGTGRNSPKDLKWVFAILTCVILVGNYKEATFFTRNLFSLWSILATLVSVSGIKSAPIQVVAKQVPKEDICAE